MSGRINQSESLILLASIHFRDREEMLRKIIRGRDDNPFLFFPGEGLERKFYRLSSRRETRKGNEIGHASGREMVVGQTGALHRRVPRKSRGTLWRRRRAQAPPTYPVAASRLWIFSLVSRQLPLESRGASSFTLTRLESNPPSPFPLDARSSREREREIFLVLESMPWIRGGSRRDFKTRFCKTSSLVPPSRVPIMREKKRNGC